nr:uncharacterized protein LOC123768900 [Procambarus clarkii]
MKPTGETLTRKPPDHHIDDKLESKQPYAKTRGEDRTIHVRLRFDLLEKAEPRENLWVQTPSKQRWKPRLGLPLWGHEDYSPQLSLQASQDLEQQLLLKCIDPDGLAIGEGHYIHRKAPGPSRHEEVHLGVPSSKAKGRSRRRPSIPWKGGMKRDRLLARTSDTPRM